MKTSKLLRIRGKVQGVFFRESIKDEAKKLGVSGWVRNRGDGSVEALLQGEEELVAELIRWAHQGPRRARVDSVEITEAPRETILSHFTRKETE